jgi:hypothetical protein
MPNPTKYDPTKKYVVSGDALNALQEQIDTNKVIEFSGYKVNRNPGVGTCLKIDLAGAIPPMPWDLVPTGSGIEGEYDVYAPGVYYSRSDITLTYTVTTTPFVPVAGRWLVMKFTSLTSTTPTVLQRATWTGYPNAHRFNAAPPFAFVEANIPLWRFWDADAPARVPLLDGVWGQKLVNSAPLRAFHVLAPTDNGHFSTIDLA